MTFNVKNWRQRLLVVLSPALERLGWSVRPGEDELSSQLRGDLIRALGTVAEDPVTQDRARALFAALRKNPRFGGSQFDPGVGGDPGAYRRSG